MKHDDPFKRKVRGYMHTLRTVAITSARSCSRSRAKRCCLTTFLIMIIAIVVGWVGGTKLILPVLYPEQALWMENMCNIDVLTVRNIQSDGTTSASQRDRIMKHHPMLASVIVPVEFGVRLLKDTFASGPVPMTKSDMVVLVGMHHKTGSVLARKLFASACLRIRQCGVFLVTSGSEVDMMRTLEDPSVRLVSHPQWPWMPQQLLGASRPYLFIHFWRNPASKLSSGYLYHKTGVEKWTSTFSFSAQKICNAPRETICDHLKICRDCCVDVVKQSRGRNTSQGVAVHVERAQKFTCQLLKSGEGTMLDLLLGRDLRGGLLVEAAIEYFETYRMAQIWNKTRSDPYSLNIELDSMMADFPSAVDSIISFLMTGSSKQFTKAVNLEKARIKDDALVFNMGSGSSSNTLASIYSSIYNSPAYQHSTEGEEKAKAREEVNSLLCTHRPLQALFQPVFDMLGTKPNCPHRRRSRLLHTTKYFK